MREQLTINEVKEAVAELCRRDFFFFVQEFWEVYNTREARVELALYNTSARNCSYLAINIVERNRNSTTF